MGGSLEEVPFTTLKMFLGEDRDVYGDQNQIKEN